jgi:hypothetical protein
MLPGVLVVDRYNGYNKLPVKIQYCYAHLLRAVEKLAKDCPDNEEVALFTGALIPLLAHAQHLKSQDISDGEYYRQANELRDLAITNLPVIMSQDLKPGGIGYENIDHS